MRAILLSILIGISALTNVRAQGAQSADLPDDVMRQVVSRILRFYFKPLENERAVYISDHQIKREWLPDIKGRRFVVLTDAEIRDDRRAFFFRPPEVIGHAFQIGFGYGVPSCEGTGDTWRFRVAEGRVRLWPLVGTGWGMGCASEGYDATWHCPRQFFIL
jgi:hypothetical protein